MGTAADLRRISLDHLNDAEIVDVQLKFHPNKIGVRADAETIVRTFHKKSLESLSTQDLLLMIANLVLRNSNMDAGVRNTFWAKLKTSNEVNIRVSVQAYTRLKNALNKLDNTATNVFTITIYDAWTTQRDETPYYEPFDESLMKTP